MNMSKKKLIFYFTLLVFLIGSLYFHFFLDPTLTKTQMSLREISVLRESVTSIEKKKVEVNNIQKDEERFHKIISEKQASLPAQLDSYDLIYLLSQANSGKLDRRSLIFLDPISRQDFYILPVRFSFITDTNGLMEFFIYLEKLPNQPTISYIQISANKIEDNDWNRMDVDTKMRYNLEVELTLNFFTRGNEE